MTERQIILFWRKVNKEVIGAGCWYWTGALTEKGYGAVNLSGKVRPAHSLSYYLIKGPIPKGLFVLHKCHTSNCVNPDHLHLGTLLENNQAMFSSGRSRYQATAVDESVAKKVKDLVYSGQTQTKVAALFNLSDATVSNIVNNRNWYGKVEEPTTKLSDFV